MHTSPHLSGASPVWTTHVPTLANGTRFHSPGNEHSLRIQEDMRAKAVVLGFQGAATSSVPGNFRARQLPVGNISLICLGEAPAVLTGLPASGSSRAADPPLRRWGAGSELQSSLWGVGGSRCCSRNWENPRTPGTRRERVLIRAERMGLRQRGRTC